MDLHDNNPEATQAVLADIPEPTGQPAEPVAQATPPSQEVATTPEQPAQPVQEQTPAPVDTAPAPAEPVAPADEPAAPSHSAKERIVELNDKVKTLSDTLLDLTGLEMLSPNAPYQPQIKPGTDITPEQYQQDVVKTADSIVTIKMAFQNNLNRIKDEIKDSIQEYPELDKKNKDSFNRDIAKVVQKSVESFIKSNPTGNVKEYVGELMTPYKAQIQKKVDQEVNRQQGVITKQAQETALRPTNPPAQAPEPKKDESIEEMETRLGLVY